MRRIFLLPLACIAAGVVGGCSSPEQVVQSPDIPTAGVRFINAVPDTGGANGLDFRFVDIIENNAQFRILFGDNPVTAGGFTASNQVEFKAAKAGRRYFKIFLDDTLQAVASTVLNTTTLPIDPISNSVMPNDTTLVLEAGKNYTVILWGNARGNDPAMRITAFEDDPADPGSNVGLRVINATSNPIDVTPYATGSAVPSTPTWAAVPPLTVSSVVTAPAGPIQYDVRAAGTTTTLFADGTAMPGAAATVDLPSTPGTNIAGSVVTAIILPRTVAGSKAPQTKAFLVPQMSFMWDHRPPRGCNPNLC